MLPQKVREAAERADRLHAEAYGNTTQVTPVQPVVDVDPPVVEVPQAVVPVEPPAAVPPAPAANWEEKYRVLNGKYQAEVPRMAEQIRELKSSMQLLQEAAAAPAPTPVPAIDVSGITPDQVVEQFGEDFAKAVGAIASQIADQRADQVRGEFKPQLETVEKRSAESAREGYMRELARLVPEWQVIDTDDNFTAFLDEADELSGRSRRFFFQEADKHMDAARVAKFFRAFKGNSTAPTAPVVPAGPSAIDAMLQPSSNRTSEAPQGKRFWTQADIRKFYVDVRQGRFTPQESKRIESDIFAAQRENRMAA